MNAIAQIAKAVVRGFREQTVTEVSRLHRQPYPDLYLVLVTTIYPHRVKADYFHCYAEQFAALQRGETPEELGLDVLEIDDKEPSHG